MGKRRCDLQSHSHGGVLMRVSQRFKLCCHVLVATVTATFLAIPPTSPAVAAPPVAPAGGRAEGHELPCDDGGPPKEDP